MSDTLNQVAKRLKQNKNTTEYNSTRYAMNFPMIERVRDSFTATIPFQMEIKALPNQSTKITLIFYEAIPCGTVGG